ncbi:WD repeat and SOCS box-containing protein 1-like isoform X2 [Limulus polyphemus]|uniref:WD repeat and SOCS box-containing protein 1-like isoform X2 n=1 Tax=Limulus polyphemus TaxID=6850 RepID=A0ABM1BRR2_LIMPO|nr:WD repeat and SOCS box-containing protein 1-like isoform X2 [Limulus polyphemus]
MASFKNKTRDEIPTAKLLAQLKPSEVNENYYPNDWETWQCAFAPDESYFAWSCGNRLVTLVPWNRCKSTLPQLSEVLAQLVLPKPGIRASTDDTDKDGHKLPHKTITIDCGCLVRSVAFGSATSDKKHLSSKAFWTHFSVSKDLILATGLNNGRIRTWDIFTGHLILELMDHRSVVTDLAFAPNGSLILASVSQDATIKFWDLNDDGNMFKTLKMNGKSVNSCAWSPDARMLATVGMCTSVYVWDMNDYSLKLRLNGHMYDVVACEFSPDGSLIATASWDTQVILWNSYSGMKLRCFGHLFPPPRLIYASGANGTWVRGLSFSPDGTHIGTVADDGYVRFWDILSHDDPVAVGSVEEALCCTYSPSGRVLAVGGGLTLNGGEDDKVFIV